MLFVVISLLISQSLFADDMDAIKKDAEQFSKKMLKSVTSDKLRDMSIRLAEAISKLPEQNKDCHNCSSQIVQVAQPRSEYTILVFVSFSMPKSSLVLLNQQAQRYNANLIMRGIYKNSFIKTKKKILEIDESGLSYDVDPQLFTQYNIKKVPTFVYVKDEKEVHRLSGNVSLEFAYSKLIGNTTDQNTKKQTK